MSLLTLKISSSPVYIRCLGEPRCYPNTLKTSIQTQEKKPVGKILDQTWKNSYLKQNPLLGPSSLTGPVVDGGGVESTTTKVSFPPDPPLSRRGELCTISITISFPVLVGEAGVRCWWLPGDAWVCLARDLPRSEGGEAKER
jgi:hypothetical protein